MGQAINAMHRRLLGTEAGNLSVVDRFWRIGQRIIQFLRRLFGRGAGKSPSDEALPIYLSSGSSKDVINTPMSGDYVLITPNHHYIDIETEDSIVCESTIREVASLEEKVDGSRSYITDEISPVPECGHLKGEQQSGGINEILFEIIIGEDSTASVEERNDSSRSYITDEISPVSEFGHLQGEQQAGGINEILSEITIGEVDIASVEERDDNSHNYITDEISPVPEFRHPKAEKQACEEILFERTFAEVLIALVEEKACRGASYITDRISPVPEKPLKNTSLGSLGHYSWDQTILLVGEGDFSFSASLAVAFGDASNMIATSLNHIEFLQKNYKRAEMNIMKLKGRGCKVMHGVDATKMANLRRLQFTKFDCIVFNFPHAGFTNRQATRDAEISKHQDLVRGFMANAKNMIKPDVQIHIAHKCIGFFREWNLKELGTSEGLRLVEESPFKLKDYPGYSTKYGYGGDADFDCKPSKTYKFQLATSSKKKKGRRKQKK